MQSTFIGKLNGENILHMHKGGGQMSTTPDINSIFHSKLPHVFITNTTRINPQANINGYQIFDVSSILPYLDQQGIVYLVKLTHQNGLQRIMGAGVSSIQEFNQVGGSTQFTADITEFYFSAQSVDIYTQQMWLPSVSSNPDQCAQNRQAQQYLFKNRQTFPVQQQGSPGQAIGQVQSILLEQFNQASKTSNMQWQKGSNSKGFLAIRDGWRWPHFSSAQDVMQSNYNSVEQVYGGTRGYYSLLSASGGSSWSHLQPYGPLQYIEILETNLRNGPSGIYQVPLTNANGQIKISNSDFLIGGLDLRQAGYKIISTVDNSIKTNFQGGGDSALFHPGYQGAGISIPTIPQYSSWQLDSNQGSITVGGVPLWNQNNPPLKFLSNANFHIPATKIPVTTSPQYLGQVSLGGEGTIVLLFNARSISQSTMYPGALQASRVSSGLQVGSRVPINDGGYDGWQNYSILVLPQGQFVPIQQVISSSPADYNNPQTRNYQIQKTWLYNQGGGIVRIYQNLTTPPNLSYLSPDIMTQGLDIFAARLV